MQVKHALYDLHLTPLKSMVGPRGAPYNRINEWVKVFAYASCLNSSFASLYRLLKDPSARYKRTVYNCVLDHSVVESLKKYFCTLYYTVSCLQNNLHSNALNKYIILQSDPWHHYKTVLFYLALGSFRCLYREANKLFKQDAYANTFLLFSLSCC